MRTCLVVLAVVMLTLPQTQHILAQDPPPPPVIVVYPDPPNHPPVIVSTPPTEATVGDPYVYEISAQDPDGDPMAIDLVEAPDGMMLDPQTGVIQWVPGTLQTGTYTVEIQVYDCFGASTPQSWEVTVTAGGGG